MTPNTPTPSERALKACVCGQPAQIDHGGVSEIAGRQWGSVGIACTREQRYGCFREVSVTYDLDADDGATAEAAAIAAWNRRPDAAPEAEGVRDGGPVDCYACGTRQVNVRWIEQPMTRATLAVAEVRAVAISLRTGKYRNAADAADALDAYLDAARGALPGET